MPCLKRKRPLWSSANSKSSLANWCQMGSAGVSPVKACNNQVGSTAPITAAQRRASINGAGRRAMRASIKLSSQALPSSARCACPVPVRVAS